MPPKSSLLTPTTLRYLANTAAVISAFPTVVGLRLLIDPKFGLKVLSFPEPTNPEDRKLVHGLVRLFGVRDLAIGLTTLAIWYHKEAGYKPLGAAMLAGAMMVVADGWVSRMVIGKGEWFHWGFVPLNVGVGAGLLGWI